MDLNTFRPNHIEDYLVQLHSGQWFSWSDAKNKVYANVKLTEKVGIDGNIVDNPITELPTEQECIDGLAQMQSDFDALEYSRNRAKEYPSWRDQMDMMWHDKKDGTTTWEDAVQAVKDAYPKA